MSEMERAFSILLAASFIGIALFGFSVTSAATASGHVGCVADAFQALQGSACPVSGNPLTLLASHLASLQTFVGSAGLWFAALLALAAFAFMRFAGELVPRASVLIPYFASVEAHPGALAKHVRWTALHESSPHSFFWGA